MKVTTTLGTAMLLTAILLGVAGIVNYKGGNLGSNATVIADGNPRPPLPPSWLRDGNPRPPLPPAILRDGNPRPPLPPA